MNPLTHVAGGSIRTDAMLAIIDGWYFPIEVILASYAAPYCYMFVKGRTLFQINEFQYLFRGNKCHAQQRVINKCVR